MPANIILIGFMGSGKTTVGCRLAKQTGRRFIDTDNELEQETGMSVPHIFTYGESYFRGLEAETLRKTCLANLAVIATGGGAVEYAGNIEVMRRSGIVCYLRWPVEELFAHVKGGTDRPLLNVPDPLAEMKTLLNRRDPLYLSAAHIVIECSGKQIKTITDEIEARVK